MSDPAASTPLDASQLVITSPFTRWHARGKFTTMERLFRQYVGEHARFADIGCGTGDALAVAALCRPSAQLWGLDIDSAALAIAQQRVPKAILRQGDMHAPDCLPKGEFDVVHEFGAAFLARGWDLLAKAYLSLLREGGILLWELPQKWSTAHISYLFTVAPKRSRNESKLRRIFRSFFPSKYRFESDRSVLRALEGTGCTYAIVERVPIWYFYFGTPLSTVLDFSYQFFGDDLFDDIDRITSHVWPRYAGYYLVIRKTGSRRIS